MQRFAANEIETWLKNKNRKLMVLSGVRQVSKTWLVRDLAERQKLKLVELNFERLPSLPDPVTVSAAVLLAKDGWKTG